jgi:hypothetical protein
MPWSGPVTSVTVDLNIGAHAVNGQIDIAADVEPQELSPFEFAMC